MSTRYLAEGTVSTRNQETMPELRAYLEGSPAYIVGSRLNLTHEPTRVYAFNVDCQQQENKHAWQVNGKVLHASGLAFYGPVVEMRVREWETMLREAHLLQPLCPCCNAYYDDFGIIRHEPGIIHEG